MQNPKLIQERRKLEASKLRVYIDTLRAAESISDAQWLENWVSALDTAPNADWLSRAAWIGYLKNCIIVESEKLVNKAA